LERKALPTNFLSQRKFDQRNVYFPRSVFDKTFLKSLVKVFACKKVLAQVLSLEKKWEKKGRKRTPFSSSIFVSVSVVFHLLRFAIKSLKQL
jgi:hypothetical protein